MKSKVNFILIVILLVVSGYMISSCKKPKPPKAIVTVYNGEANNVPVEGATVKVFSNPSLTDTSHQSDVGYVFPDSMILEVEGVTDEFGQVSFEFRYESILHVEAKLGVNKKDTLIGYGALILKEDETYSETIIMKYKPTTN
ncbi:MAG: hypothetical protein Kow0068_13130 [Marinilabiliales bacterium]